MDNQQAILKIRIINWTLIATALFYPMAWIVLPGFMMKNGGGFIILGVLNTLLLFKLLLFTPERWNENLRQIRKKIPWLIYIALMAVTLHYYLRSAYWEPKRQKSIQAIEEKYNTNVE